MGVLGGMGPVATADFYAKLVAATPARRDQEHLRVVIWSDPMVPDRTAALLEGGPEPTRWLERGARVLKRFGAEFVVVPCNTAHAFLPAVQESVGIHVIDMIAETARYLRQLRPGGRVGVLSTSGTVQAGLYQDWLTREGMTVLVPGPEEQRQLVQTAIQRIKAGETGAEVKALLVEAGEDLARRGADALVAGCTELPLVFGSGDASMPVVDPSQVLAEATLAAASNSGRGIGGPEAPPQGRTTE